MTVCVFKMQSNLFRGWGMLFFSLFRTWYLDLDFSTGISKDAPDNILDFDFRYDHRVDRVFDLGVETAKTNSRDGV